MDNYRYTCKYVYWSLFIIWCRHTWVKSEGWICFTKLTGFVGQNAINNIFYVSFFGLTLIQNQFPFSSTLEKGIYGDTEVLSKHKFNYLFKLNLFMYIFYIFFFCTTNTIIKYNFFDVIEELFFVTVSVLRNELQIINFAHFINKLYYDSHNLPYYIQKIRRRR